MKKNTKTFDASFCHQAATKPYYSLISNCSSLARRQSLSHFLAIIQHHVSKLRSIYTISNISPRGVGHEAKTMLANQANLEV